MSDKWEFGYLDEPSWHKNENENGGILTPGMPIEHQLELSQIGNLDWYKVPIMARSITGDLVKIEGQYMLERGPRPWVTDDTPSILLGRVVSEDFQIVQGSDLARLATNVSNETGWKLRGAANLSNAEVAFVQLGINKMFRIGGREHEAHKATLFFGDNKKGGATFGGITYTRIQCHNTWRAALSGDGVWKMRHDDSPVDRMEFLAAKVVLAYKAMEEEERWLNAFFNQAMPENLFQRFTYDVFQDPPITNSMIEGEHAMVMQQAGQTNGFDLTRVIELGDRSRVGYEQRLDLAQRRRGHMENAYINHNGNFPDSRDTYYAAAQALTHTTSHGPFRGDSEHGAMFGVRADFNTKGFEWLKGAIEEEGVNE